LKAFQKILSQRGQAAPVFIILFIAALFFLTLITPKLHPQYFIYFLLGIAVFVAAFLNTNFALGVFIFAMLFSPELPVGQVADRAVVVRVDDIFLLMIFLGWMAKLAVFKEMGVLKRTPLNGPIFAYIFACIVSTALMLIEDRGTFARSAFYLLKYFEYFILYFLVVNNIENFKQVKVFVFLLILTCFLVSVYGLYSHFILGLRATAPFEGQEGEANTLAGYLTLLMAVVMGLFFYAPISQRERLGLGVVILFAFAALIFSLSRSGWLTFMVMYLSFIAMAKRGRGFLFFVLLIMALSAPFLTPKEVRHRVSSTFEPGGKMYKVMGKAVRIDESGAARIDSWEHGFRKVLNKPLFGFGIPGAQVIDNQYIRVLVETGFFGSIMFLFLLFGIFKVSRDSLVSVEGNPWAQGVIIGFIAGFFGLLLHGFSAATFILIRIMEPFWFLAAIVVALPHILPHEPKVDAGSWSTT
jgi:O-antigen ligase